ncbi:MAG: hypothetical protein K6L80_02715 [Agarilytica sp.]
MPAWANTDDWIGLDSYGGHIGIQWGAYEAGGESYAVNLSLPMIFLSQFNTFYSDYRSDDGDYEHQSQQLGVFWNTDPFQRYSLGVGYLDGGRSSDFRTKDYSLYFQYLSDSQWHVKLSAIKGKSEINTVGFSPVIDDYFRSLSLHEIDRLGWGGSFGLDGVNHGFRIGTTLFDYDDSRAAQRGFIDLLVDDIRSNEERFYYQEIYLAHYSWYRLLGETREDALTATNAVFQNYRQELRDYVDGKLDEDPKNVLSNHEISLDYFYSKDLLMISMGFFVYESYIQKDYFNQSYVSVNYQATEHYSYGFTLSYNDENVELYGELSLGFDW